MRFVDRFLLFSVQSSITALAVHGCLNGIHSNYWEALLLNAIGVLFTLALAWLIAMSALYFRAIAHECGRTLRMSTRPLISDLRRSLYAQ